MINSPKYTCPCCGYKVFDNPPGSFEFCPICYWEDEAMQLRCPTEIGANSISLVEAQDNFEKFGVSHIELKVFVRDPTAEDERDLNWRKVDLKTDKIESKNDRTTDATIYPIDLTKLYYWEENIGNRLV
ncbi:MAG: CPCC family cysteine-rich protein [Candidatus Shapirobacteria bacterium]|nr:CPCC family cysteine-rich protein [Candidatus Shapirobacteria bacterium]